MNPAVVSLHIIQGATFRKKFVWKVPVDPLAVPIVYTPVDLTGYTGKMQIRPKIGDTTLIIELTTANGGITLTNLGEVKLFIEDEVTAAFSFKHAVYDLELTETSTDDTTRLLKGSVSLDLEVTR